ncbi:serine hydrolase [Deinococcus pimensis]|uniref:serine hydrolase n=1 Tax=Deinococcus pimensis TaxID=309888 RepID=UPI0004BCB45A|nr:serine hydrolase [Deinococcus pimensis]
MSSHHDPVPIVITEVQSGERGLAGHPGHVSVVVRDLTSGEVLREHDPDRVYPAASTIKIALLVAALRLVDAGAAHLDERPVMDAGDRVGGDGVLKELVAGLAPTLRDLLTLMIVVSDNTATNMVIDRVGVDTVNAFLREAGLSGTELLGKLQLPPERQSARQRAGERNRTTARDLAELLLRLARGELLSRSSTEVALDILSRQQHQNILTRHLPRDEAGERLWRVASKHGELRGVHHDVGVVWSPRPVVLAILSEGGLDPREHPDNHEVRLLARLAADLVRTYGEASSSVSQEGTP